jgi:spermidine synthase
VKPLAILIAIAALAVGVLFEDNHYRLREVGHPSDQMMLDHRDSSYTSMTWVGSRSDNYLQLRFFDKVEGGLCLRPTWSELNDLALKDPRLQHLRYQTVTGGSAPAATWAGSLPDPGTLPNSPYVRFFPAGVLLNEALITKAGGDLRKADPHILIIGLGSSAGILVLAHHFPQAAITVVDIDQRVIDIVTDHIPLTRWLQTQKTADGSPRLQLIAKDARQYVRFDAPRLPRPFDLVILDAYTAGSTIPSHLMTREFFAECANALSPDGMVLGNIIGSYTGEKHQVVGGALRSLRAAGLTEAYNIPVISSFYDSPATLDTKQPRNNIVMASRKALDPRHRAAAWQRMQEFEPFPELPSGTYLSTQYVLLDGNKQLTSLLPGEAVDATDPALRTQLKAENPVPGAPQYAALARSEDSQVIAAVRRAAAAWYTAQREKDHLVGSPVGWDDAAEAKMVWRRETDWVKAAREVWRVSLIGAKDAATHGGAALVGPLENERAGAEATWGIPDAPLFTDQMPNADIVNH